MSVEKSMVAALVVVLLLLFWGVVRSEQDRRIHTISFVERKG